jgi:coenzyme Q-binding protein COQ10
MEPISIHAIVDFTPAHLYGVAVDVEAYPEFLPHCVATRIVRRETDALVVDNVFRWGPVPISFRSRAALDPPNGLDIRAIDGAPLELELKWRFAPFGQGTQVTFEMVLGSPGFGLDTLLVGVFREQAEQTHRAFLRRAAETLRLQT